MLSGTTTRRVDAATNLGDPLSSGRHHYSSRAAPDLPFDLPGGTFRPSRSIDLSPQAGTNDSQATHDPGVIMRTSPSPFRVVAGASEAFVPATLPEAPERSKAFSNRDGLSCWTIAPNPYIGQSPRIESLMPAADQGDDTPPCPSETTR